MGDGADMALQYAINTELDAGQDELGNDCEWHADVPVSPYHSRTRRGRGQNGIPMEDFPDLGDWPNQ